MSSCSSQIHQKHRRDLLHFKQNNNIKIFIPAQIKVLSDRQTQFKMISEITELVNKCCDSCCTHRPHSGTGTPCGTSCYKCQ
ncbi:hypothetical protein VTL71DRAFT_6310, partial [Oculimacula yallundae]